MIYKVNIPMTDYLIEQKNTNFLNPSLNMSFYFWDVFYTISSLISDKFHYNIINSKGQRYLVLLKIGCTEVNSVYYE